MTDKKRFTIQCYAGNVVAYSHPDHPRHAFPEDWDCGSHPRFDFGRLQGAFERLIAKGYTVHVNKAKKVTSALKDEATDVDIAEVIVSVAIAAEAAVSPFLGSHETTPSARRRAVVEATIAAGNVFDATIEAVETIAAPLLRAATRHSIILASIVALEQALALGEG